MYLILPITIQILHCLRVCENGRSPEVGGGGGVSWLRSKLRIMYPRNSCLRCNKPYPMINAHTCTWVQGVWFLLYLTTEVYPQTRKMLNIHEKFTPEKYPLYGTSHIPLTQPAMALITTEVSHFKRPAGQNLIELYAYVRRPGDSKRARFGSRCCPQVLSTKR